MRRARLLLMLLLAGCETLPDHYQQLPWAKVSVDQAWSECMAAESGNPLLNRYRCMEAKGWRAAW